MLLSGATVLLLHRGAGAQPGPGSDFAGEVLPEGHQRDFVGRWSEIQPFGTNPPTNAEKDEAQAILAGAPAGPTPLTVAQYFLGLQGPRARFRGGWDDRWNPVIV